MKNPIVVAGHKLLGFKLAYNAYQSIVGGVSYRNRFVSENVLSSTRILDIGCGTGVVAKKLREDQSYTGVDSSLRYVEAARELVTPCKEFKIVAGDVSKEDWVISLGGESFDSALALGLLHHLDDQGVVNLLQSLRPFIESGGCLYTVDPVITKYSSRAARWFAENDRGNFVRDPEELESLFKQCGYRANISLKQKEFRIPLDTIEIAATLA
jgi:SAM-dependent methyltransferase